MTGPAALDGMPHPADLRVHSRGGTTFVTAGQMVIACYPDGDVAMRNVAVAVARQLGFSGQQVAQVMGLSDSYVATLHQRALREGAAGLVRPSGPKPKLSLQAWARAAKWRAAGASEAQIAARLGVAQATVSRHLAGAGRHQLPFGEPGSTGQPQSQEPAAEGPAPQPGREEPAPWNSSSTKSTPPRPACPATPSPSPTTSRQPARFNYHPRSTAGVLRLGVSGQSSAAALQHSGEGRCWVLVVGPGDENRYGGRVHRLYLLPKEPRPPALGHRCSRHQSYRPLALQSW